MLKQRDMDCACGLGAILTKKVRCWQILLQKSAILVVGLPLRPLEADSDYSFSHWALVGV